MNIQFTDSFWNPIKKINPFWNKGIYIGSFYLTFDVLYMIRQLIYRIKHGFWHYEVYSFNEAVIHWMIPRLERYLYEHLHSNLEKYPVGMDYEEWISDLKKIIWAFKAEIDSDFDRKYKIDRLIMTINEENCVTFDHKDGKHNYNKEDEEREENINKGYELFGKHFRKIWS